MPECEVMSNVRKLAKKSGKSQRSLCDETGIFPASMTRFWRGHGISATNLDEMARSLGFKLELTPLSAAELALRESEKKSRANQAVRSG